MGLFATADTDFWRQGLLSGGGVSQLTGRAVGVVALGGVVAVTSGVLFLVLKHAIGLRVTAEDELESLDVLEHGTPHYGPEVFAPVPETTTAATPQRAPAGV